MVLIGCDFHPSWQQVSWMNRETGEAGDQKLVHEPGAVEKFYQQFPTGKRNGMEATGKCQGFVEMLNGQIDLLDQAVVEAAEKNEKARLLMTQPGVGPITSMAFVLTMGDVKRFQRGKQVASYLGLIPREYSSGGHQRLGSISKQGNTFLRMLLVEAAQGAVRCDPGFRNEELHRCYSKPKGWEKVAVRRKLAI